MFEFLRRRPEPVSLARMTTPLPCPLHGALLIPEARGNGEYGLFCPICRLACQPRLTPKYSATTRQGRPAQPTPRPGAILSTARAKERVAARLKRTKLVLIDPASEYHTGSTGALDFANSLTEATLPRMPKLLKTEKIEVPRVG